MDIIPIFKDIKNCIAFLTRIPINTKIDIPKQLAPKMWLFPIVGFLIGLIISLLGLFLFQILPSLLVGFILLSILLFLTGAHHLDGLLDFGDGLMVIGSPEHKIEVMHDVSIGAGGFSLGLMVLSLTGLAMGYLTNYLIIAFISCEVI
ncbi:MAG: adenosylcobinamide-GDP ribazoletransferase, partial [Promethearchaeota archaeon]